MLRIVLKGKYMFKKELPEMSGIISFSKLKGNMENKGKYRSYLAKISSQKEVIT